MDEVIDGIYRRESRRVLATLIRLLHGFDAAEEALHDAFAAAADQWPRDGVPTHPYAWLVSAGRFRTIDRWRRQSRLAAVLPDLATLTADVPVTLGSDTDEVEDDELRLILICCHPALPPDARMALTLREVGGLTTEEIARACLTRTATIAQRIVRAKAKIRDDRIPYDVPGRAEWPARLASALQVVYLIFNEGYAATQGPDLIRAGLCSEAIRLGRLLAGLVDDAEVLGLLAVMLLHESRRPARLDSHGDIVLLEDQDRGLWNRALIAEAGRLVAQAMASRSVGPYTLQAAIAAVHAHAQSLAATDWDQVVALYDVLLRVAPSPVIALNRAAAVGQRDGAAAGLAAVEAVMAQGGLEDYHLAHAARADLYRRLGQDDQARQSYRRALDLARLPAEQRFLRDRLQQLPPAGMDSGNDVP